MKELKQSEIWDKIAPEWYEFKDNPATHTISFLNKQTGKVLDLGSGSGRHMMNIRQGKMYEVDFSKEMIKLAKKKAKKNKIDAEFAVAQSFKLPYEDNFFDAAISIAQLHCVETKAKREKTVKELYRVLKSGGKAEIAVWDKDSKRFKNASKDKYVDWRGIGKRYYYLYDTQEIHDLFEKVGFKILKKFPKHLNIIFIVQKP